MKPLQVLLGSVADIEQACAGSEAGTEFFHDSFLHLIMLAWGELKLLSIG